MKPLLKFTTYCRNFISFICILLKTILQYKNIQYTYFLSYFRYLYSGIYPSKRNVGIFCANILHYRFFEFRESLLNISNTYFHELWPNKILRICNIMTQKKYIFISTETKYLQIILEYWKFQYVWFKLITII